MSKRNNKADIISNEHSSAQEALLIQSSQPLGRPKPARDLSAGIKTLSLQPKFAQRPGTGTRGRGLGVRANFFKLNLNSDAAFVVQQFKCRIDNSNNAATVLAPRQIERVVWLLLTESPDFENVASNYTDQFYSLDRSSIPYSRYLVNYFDSEELSARGRLFVEVTIESATLVDMDVLHRFLSGQTASIDTTSSASYLQILNAMLERTVFVNPRYVTHARKTKFFDLSRPDAQVPLKDGLQANRGYFKSIRFGANALFLNMNKSASAMVPAANLQTLIQCFVPSGHRAVHKLIGIRVEVRYSGTTKVKTIRGLGQPDANQDAHCEHVRFDCAIHSRETVQQHFKRAFTLTVPPRTWAVKFNNDVIIPACYCKVIPGQAYRGVLSGSQTSTMLQFACVVPAVNRHQIRNEGMPALEFNEPNGLYEKFGVSLANNLGEEVFINARYLPTPTIKFMAKQETPSTGAWNLDNKRFFRPAPKFSYSILDIHPSTRRATDKVDDLRKSLKGGIYQYFGYAGVGPTLTETVSISVSEWNDLATGGSKDGGSIQKFLRKHLEHQVDLVFVILPNKNQDLYHQIKKIADCRVGIHTVCMARNPSSNQVNILPGNIANELLKVNLKLGGVNWHVMPDADSEAILSGNTMVVGADVTHPSPGAQQGAPSLAGVVASIDQFFNVFPGIFNLQARRQEQLKNSSDKDEEHGTKKKAKQADAIENILEFKKMMASRLQLYAQRNKVLPDKIVYMRDGVSDGQFDMVIDSELPQLKAACREIYGTNQMPGILVVVVQKRHHTRFFADETSKALFDQKGNPRPGLVVDGEITSPTFFDFYNTAHRCIKGTSRPAKYNVLYDDMNLSVDQIQAAIYQTTFVFGRSTTSIGIHPAARLADLFCDRGRNYLRYVYNPIVGSNANKSNYDKAGTWPGTVSPKLADTMFYI